MNQELLSRCSNAAAPSGFEGPVRAIIRQELGGISQVSTTTAGNIVCELPGSGGPTVALLSHMDEIGFMVQGITPDGFLLIVPLGGWWNHTLPSQRVLVHTRGGRSIPGQIGTKPPHLLPESQRQSVMPNDALFIDIGASSGEEVAACGITIGCAVTPDVQLQPLELPHRWMGKAFDNRAGVYCMVESMKRLAAEKPACTVLGIGTVQEEVGTRGAFGAAFSVVPDIALILEGTTAADLPMMEGRQKVCAPGKGPVIPYMDGGTVYDRRLFELLRGLAVENRIPWQTKEYLSGGTDAGAIQKSRAGVRVAAISAAVRYLHTPSSVCAVEDCENILKLARLFVKAVAEG